MQDNQQQEMLAIARRLAGLPADKRAVFRQRLRASGIDVSALPVVPPAVRPAQWPLSFAQQRLWFLQQLEPHSAAYNIPAALRLAGPLDVPALEGALRAAIARHAALRTVFREVDGAAVQEVLPAADCALQVRAASEEEALRLARAEAATPFDLGTGPLVRAALFRVAEDDHILALTVHHIVSDGWSMHLLMKELAAHYAGQGAALPAIPIQYADYALWQREWLTDDVLATQLDYWKAALGEDQPVLELPTDRPRPAVPGGHGAKLRFALDEALAAGLRRRAREHGATLFMTMLAAFGVLLHRLTSQRDIRVGVPLANRHRVETENVIGLFVNTQVMRIRCEARTTFAQLLADVREAALGAQAHPDLPFERLVEALQPERNMAHAPLFQVMFDVQAAAVDQDTRMGAVAVRSVAQDSGAAQFDLSLDIIDRQGRLDAVLTYRTDLFDAATAGRFAGYYANLLRAAVAAPDTRIGQLAMLDAAEQRLLTRDWAAGAAVDADFVPVHEAFAAQAAATPDAVALVHDDVEISYAALNARANRLAHHLIARGIGTDARVGIRMARGPDMIVAVLATLKAGAAYVPLDPDYPQERLAYMMDDAGIALLLDGPVACDDQPAHDPDVPVHGAQLAYVMYTSGSTGKPKGVGMIHAALAAHVAVSRDLFRLDARERMLQFSTFNFDGFVEQLYPALTCGASVVLRGPDLWDSEELYRRILHHRITVADFTTAYWFQAVQDWAAQGHADYGVLRQVNVGGEAMPPEGLAAWRKAGLAHVRLLNTYGPTEAAVTAMVHDCAAHVDGRLPKPVQMPIGRALGGRSIYLLDADMNPVPVGVAGELCIGGALLARGYHGRPGLTAERFIPDPFGVDGARLYRTGDLARWKTEGEIEYLGRIDHQVKLRGFRIELPEIEAALLAHPAVREAIVLVREDRPGDKRLVAYLTAHGQAPAPDDLRRHLGSSLPDYMVPSAFVLLDAMPMNPNGKIERKALPAPDYASGDEQVAPRTGAEAALARIWCDVLGLDAVGIHDNFFLLGGHSLLATRLVSRIRGELACELPVRALFEAPTVAQLAERLQPAQAAALATIPVVPRDRPLPLSFAQQRLWFLQQLDPDSAAYNMPAAVRLDGALDATALEQAFVMLAARHETLRTTFREQDGEPVQVIAERADVALPLTDLSALPPEQRDAEARRIAAAEASRPFDLSRGPLLRLALIKLSATGHVLLATMHHIVSDGWSMAVLTREFAACYAAALQGRQADLAPLAVQYADFASWQRSRYAGDALDGQLAYWKEQLGAEHPVLELPADRPRPAVQSGRGARHGFALDAALTAQLRALCRGRGATPFMALLAVFDVLLERLTGQRDIRVGVPVANRPRVELEGLIGFFVNTQVMRVEIDGRQPFAALLDRVREAALGAQAHQDLPFEQLVEALQPQRSLSHAPLFQVMFNLIQADAAGLPELDGLRVSPVVRDDSVTQFDLTLDIVERDEHFDATFTYSTDLFDAATAGRFAGYYVNLLRAAVAAPDTRIGQLAMLDAAEQRLLTRDWAAGPAVGADFVPVHVAFAAQAAATPDAVALLHDDAEITYAALNARANRLAHHLIARGVGTDARVGIRMARGPDMIVAVLATLKAGAAYVPLDPDYPQERLAYMMDDAGIALLLDGPVACDDQPAHDPDVPVHGAQLAYVMYTSGSTGKPKGVGMIHAALAAHVAVSRDLFRLDARERMLQFSTFNFDGFVEQLYPALTCGASVVLRGPDLWDSEELYRRILHHRITAADFTTAYWFQAVQDWAAQGHADYGVLRQVNVGGEAMPPEGLAAWRKAGLAHVRLLNTYGPTEAAVTAMVHDCAAHVDGRLPKPVQMPIGRALGGRSIYLLDADMNPVPVGVAGELCIGGALLARGYHGRPGLTAERFIPDPFGVDGARLYRTGDLARWKTEGEGEIEYLGRIDHQVKIRGFRIELPEIEAALLAHPAVREAIVLVREDRPGDKRLVAYLTAHGQVAAPATDDLRRHLGSSLPDYMVPSAFVLLDAMPMNPNGKIERKALPAPDYAGGDEHVVPRTATESALARIWCDVLGLDTVGIHDNFFLLGGHSLLATRLVSRIRGELACELPVRALFEAPTVAQLAERLQPAHAAALAPIPLVPRDRPLPLSFAQQRLWFLQQLDPDSAAYNMPAAVRLEGALDATALEQAFAMLAARHETLRTTFCEQDGEPVQVIAERADVALPLTDLSALPPEQRDAEARRIAAAEASRPFDLARGPLLRASLLRLADDEHVLLVNMHHIVSDGWSMGIFTREFAACYRDLAAGRAPGLRPLPRQYADFAVWQRAWLADGALEAQLAYWKAQLGGEQPVLALPADRARPPLQSGRGAVQRWTLDATLASDLQQLSRAQGSTLFMTMLAAFQVLLHRLSGQDDIRVGVPNANRNRIETENLIGFFVNTQVMRARIEARQPFAALLAHVRDAALAAQAHQDLPFEQLVEALQPERDLSHAPLFQAMFNLMQDDGAARFELPGLVLTPLAGGDGTTHFDLSLDVVERQGRLEAALSYSTDLFDPATVQRFAGYYTRLLRSAAAAPATPIGQLGMLDADERRRVTTHWAAGAALPAGLPLLHVAFAAQAAATPDAVALVHDDVEISYAALNARANRLAHHLIARGVGTDARVGIRMARGPDMIVAILATLKAGGAYVPLDPDYPQERLAYMMDDAGIALLLDGPVACDDQPAHDPDVPVHGQQLAYVMYTSGSTGKPKGVAMIHAAVAAHAAVARGFNGLTPDDRVLQFSTFSFDGFVEQLFPALMCGAAVVLRGPDLWDSEELHRRILRHRVTVADFTTAYWFQAVQDWAAAGARDFGALRQVSIGGEAMPPEGLNAWRKAGLAHVGLLNTYGPTEAAVAAMSLDCAPYVAGRLPHPLQMPIGRALGGRSIYLLDADMNPVPVGVAGELCIGGALLARGYHGRPGLTAERFIPDPFGVDGARLYRTGDLARWKAVGEGEGEIEYLGRIDHQVKLRGFRIELPEIEAALLAHPAVREAIVLVREDRPGDKRLVAYLTAHGLAPAPDDLRRHLGSSLPDYMVPSAFVLLDAMPMNPNGKIERKALPAPDYAGGDEHVVPRTATESALARIWCDVLGLDTVGIHDNFFLLGGHSLLATRLVSRIRDELACELPVRALFEAPTVAQLAERLQPAQAAPLAAIPVVPRDRPLPLSFAQERLWFLQQLDPDSAAFNMPAAVRLVGALDGRALEQAFAALVARHETLRTTFREEGGSAVQVIAPALAIDMPVVAVDEETVGPRIAAELARPFDLVAGPVLRVTLLRLSAGEHVLLVVMHHIAADGWSIGVLVRELGALYAAFSQGRGDPLPPLAIQYADFACWQRAYLAGDELARQLAYWRAQLGSDHPVLNLPGDRPRPAVMSGNGDRVRFEIDPDTTARLHALGRAGGASLFMTLLSAFDVWLHAQTGRLDPIVGTDIANRTRAETEGLLGFFINQLALRADLRGNPSFGELLARTRHRVLDAYAHQDLPFNKLVESINPVRSLAYTPLFQVKLVLQNQADEALVLEGLEIRPQPMEGERAEYDLLLLVTEMAGGLECILKYSSDLFDRATATAFAQQFAALLERCAGAPSARLDVLAQEVAAMARAARMARQQAHTTQGMGTLQATRRKSIAVNSTHTLKDVQS